MNPISAVSAFNQINQINDLGQLNHASSSTSLANKVTSSGSERTTGGFGDLVTQLIQQTNSEQITADNAISDFVTGKTDNIQQVVMAMTSADLSFQFFMEVRNKVIESYNELIRMQF